LIRFERDSSIFNEAAPAVEDANELVTMMVETTEHHGPDDRVQPRTVTTTGENADSHPPMIGSTWVRP
jgi:hypothetical protein